MQDAGYFAIDTQQGVMRTDALTSSRPIIVAVTNPDEINQAFDGISYDKGASMLRMIEFFMGTQNFTNGLRVRFHLLSSAVFINVVY